MSVRWEGWEEPEVLHLEWEDSRTRVEQATQYGDWDSALEGAEWWARVEVRSVEIVNQFGDVIGGVRAYQEDEDEDAEA